MDEIETPGISDGFWEEEKEDSESQEDRKREREEAVSHFHCLCPEQASWIFINPSHFLFQLFCNQRAWSRNKAIRDQTDRKVSLGFQFSI
jgi:hypothetical protein